MHITLNCSEALYLTLRGKELPPGVDQVELRGDVLSAELDLREIPSGSRRVKLAAAAAGTIGLEATFERFASGTATFSLTAQARGLPAHKVLNLVTGHLGDALAEGLRAQGLPDDLLTVGHGDDGPCLSVHLDDAADLVLPGARVTAFDVAAGQIHVDVQLTEAV